MQRAVTCKSTPPSACAACRLQSHLAGPDTVQNAVAAPQTEWAACCHLLHFAMHHVIQHMYAVLEHAQRILKAGCGNVQTPVLRTLCNRAAFQEPSTNEVRISLDSQLHMIREGGASPKQPGDWCRDLG